LEKVISEPEINKEVSSEAPPQPEEKKEEPHKENSTKKPV
jgi:hypothetical protein